MALAASQHQLIESAWSLKEVMLGSPLEIDARHGVLVQLELREEPGARAKRFCVRSFPAGASELSEHASGLIFVERAPKSAPLLDDHCDSASSPIQAETIYREIANLGFNYLADFQTIQEAAFSDFRVLATLRAPTRWPDQELYVVHPAILEGAFQVAGMLAARVAATEYYPTKIGQIEVLESLPVEVSCRAEVRPTAGGAICSFELVDQSQRMVLRASGIEFSRPIATRSQPQAEASQAAEWFFDVHWDESPLTIRATAEVEIVWNQITPPALAGIDRILSDISATSIRADQLTGVDLGNRWLIYGIQSALGATLTEDADAVGRIVEQQLTSLTDLLRGITASDKSPAALFIVTTPAPNGPQAHTLPADIAAVHAYLTAASKEHPEIRTRALHISSQDAPESLREILAAEAREIDHNIVVWRRGGQRYVRRLVALDQRELSNATPKLRADGIYLITGGQTGLGLEVAKRLAAPGRKLILVNRTPIEQSTRRRNAIAALVSRGAEVWPVAADIANSIDVRRLFSEIQARHGRLDGIVHAAGVLRDRVVALMDRETLAAVLAPKVAGSWHLHQESQRFELDFFCLFSSLSSLTCGEGQANHAAANAFQDALALHRHALGLPALAINWGYWGETGVVASERYEQSLRQRGVEAISSELGAWCWETAISLGRAQIGIANLARERFGIQIPHGQELIPVARTAPLILESERLTSALTEEMQAYRGIDEVFDQVCVAYVESLFAQWGVFQTESQFYHDWHDLERNLPRTLPLYRQLVRRFFRMLESAGLVSMNRGRLRATRHLLRNAPQSLTHDARMRYPQASAELDLLSRAGEQLSAVLSGERTAVEALFPAGSTELVQRLYESSPFARYFHEMVASAVAAAPIAKDEPFKIIEIGGGTGATTACVLERLEGRNIEYWHTDISEAFLRRAAERFHDKPGVRFARLDINQSASDQGIELGRFDCVVAANVLHATRDLRATLRHVRELLRPSGTLLLVETTRDKFYADLTFALTPGWWEFTDHELRVDSPLVSASAWSDLLTASGFVGSSSTYPEPTSRFPNTGQQLLVAQSDASRPSVSGGKAFSSASFEQPGAAPLETDTFSASSATGTEHAVADRVAQIVSRVLKLRPERLSRERPFSELGVDSLLALEIVRELKSGLGVSILTPADLYAHTSVAKLATHLKPLVAKPPSSKNQHVPPAPIVELSGTVASATTVLQPIVPDQAPVEPKSVAPPRFAIVGLAVRSPGADNLEQFWRLLAAGTDAVGPLSVERRAEEVAANGSPPIGGFLNEVNCFDPLLFRISPAEAAVMEPRQRLFLETAYEALENAGYGGERLAGTRTGVFVGAGAQVTVAAPNVEHAEHWASGLTPSILASRIGYFLDLRGPCLTVDTACSSSLVALHLALQSLKSGECDHALVGGVHLNVQPLNFAAFETMGALASNRKVKAFDDRADGFVPAEGVCAVLVKPLDSAIRDRDYIHAVILGSAINSDGRSNGLTAPNPMAQADCLVSAWRSAEIQPASLSYVETHGTGTAIGDPIEIQGLQAAFQRFVVQNQFCRIGSLKSQIGHAEPAAGLLSVAKVVASLEHEQLPATLHFDSPNRFVRFEDSPLCINDRLIAWPREQVVRRAGVSAFGLSGTNAHVVLEEAPLATPLADASEPHPLCLSARTPQALRQLAQRYADHLETTDQRLADIGHTAATGRFHLA
ncbi:MAG: SDR family NAD(P)-dependent oxidoreductase, partial [Pirellulales bacterium]|nr:SDR family NAD(P)-dependent oxidoreductase [Pirellulales bacterium]